MIHDILFACLSTNSTSIRGFLASNAVDHFFHPSERETLTEIIHMINISQEVLKFAQLHNEPNTENEERGIYLHHFSKGVESALVEYFQEISDLEVLYSIEHKNSLCHIYNALYKQLPVLVFLRKLIREAQMQKLHGCNLLQNLLMQLQQGNIKLERTIYTVITPVKNAFLTHLANWMVFGLIKDPQSEFFIKYTPTEDNVDARKTSFGMHSPSRHLNDDHIWRYEVNMKQLPSFVLSLSADKVLFTGQTVLLFKMDRRNNENQLWTGPLLSGALDKVGELWEGKEMMYFKMIEDLEIDNPVNVMRFNSVINEIKSYVSMRLINVAMTELNLEREILLIKDFFLLGRGEFYLEFLRQVYGGNGGDKEEPDASHRNYSKSFEIAAGVMGFSDELEPFTLEVMKESNDLDESCEFGILQMLYLRFNYKWPMNLLFSTNIINRYNKIFRFLLIVKKLQYDLHRMWLKHTSCVKTKETVDLKIINLRNHLTFFLDNLQYYIQVDVLESHFSNFMKIVREKKCFEDIQRAHTVFLANVLSECFLLSEDATSPMDMSVSHIQNPIHGTLLEIFSICEKFTGIDHGDITPRAINQIVLLEDRFDLLVANLIKILADIKSATSFGPLNQFLLRLDYNHWFTELKSKPLNETK